MANRVVIVTNRNWFQRMMSSVVGVFFGILLFFGSFVLLWFNEGRVDLSKIMEGSVPASASQVDPANEGAFVSVSGNITADEPLGDPEYLQPGPYIQLHREAEMFAWEESCTSETRTTAGGGERTTTECNYDTRWTSSPEDSADFEEWRGHENPPMRVESAAFTVPSAKLGAYTLEVQAMTLPGGREISLSPENVREGAAELEGNYLFQGEGSLSEPEVGDIRISFSALPANSAVTAFGMQEGDRLVPYVHRTDDRFYSVHYGDRASAIEEVATRHTIFTWVLRGAGFLMMWIGLSMILGPVSTFFDIIPVLGNLTGAAIGFVTFGVALVLSFLTILIAIVLHNIWMMLILLLLILGGAWFIGQRRRASRVEQPVQVP